MTTPTLNPVAVDVFIGALRERGVVLAADRDLLRVTAPRGVVDEALAGEIASRKAELLGYLADAGGQPAAIPHIDRSARLPLGLVQQRMWLHNQLEPDTVLYDLAAAWRLSGVLEPEAFRNAFDAVVARHEILGMAIRAEDGEPFQDSAAHDVTLEIVDISCGPAEQRERELAARLSTCRDRRADLERGPMLRARLFRVAETEHVLLLMPHHVAWDGWSFEIFLRDLSESYAAAIAGRAAALPVLPVQYVDYAAWHRRWLQDAALEEQLAYWCRELAGEPAPLDLPTDLPRPKRFSHSGDCEPFPLSAHTMERVSRLAAAHRATTCMVLLSAWGAFVHRISGQSDFVVGVPVQARSHPDVPDLIGCFVNTLCIRLQLQPDMPFAQLVDAVRATSLGAYEHQDAPFDLLLERLVHKGDPSRTPLFQIMFSHEQMSRRVARMGALAVAEVHVNPCATPTDLMLEVMEHAGGARAVLHFSTDLFRPATIHQMRLRFELFLEAALATPTAAVQTLPVLTPEERDCLVRWNATGAPLPPAATLHAHFRQQVERTPGRAAIRFEGHATSYRELDARSDAIARCLRRRGVGAGSRVGVFHQRSPDMVASMLAVLKAGAAYVPLDPAYPTERIRFMASDAGLALVVSEAQLVTGIGWPREYLLLLDRDAADVEAAAGEPWESGDDQKASAAAYVIYTSGSTGTPKGVMVPHRAVLNFLAGMQREPGLSADDRLLAITTTSFDIAVLELFGPLCVGGEVVLASRDDATDGHALATLLDESDATVMQATPATWRMLLESGWSAQPGFKALCGGEALAPDLGRELLARGVELWNLYGPTETTVWSTCCRIGSGEEGMPIGKPIQNTQVWILDERGEPCAPGVRGEIWIGGQGVALGYLDRPELTAERFVRDPFAGQTSGDEARLYRTGDVGRWRSDGMLEHLGRIDFQVKVRGHRIEPGEIENALLTHAGVARATVLVREDKPGDVRIVAYLVAQPGTVLDEREVQLHLGRSMPVYMLPQHIVVLEDLPLLPNGKIDRKSLPPPRVTSAADAVRQHAPCRDPRINYLVAVWSELLGTPAQPDDNFFDLGGHSMLAVQMVNRVALDTGVRFKLMRLASQDLSQLASELPHDAGAGVAAPVPGLGARFVRDAKRLFSGRLDSHP